MEDHDDQDRDRAILTKGYTGEVNPYELLVVLVHDLRDGDDDEPCYECGHTFGLHEIGGDEDPPGFKPFCTECNGVAHTHRFVAFPENWGRERFACCGAWSHDGHALQCPARGKKVEV